MTAVQHTGTTTLRTDRLTLRRWREDDAEAIFTRWASDPAAARFWSWQPHRDLSETRTFLREWIAAYANPAYYHWAIADRNDDSAIGYIYLTDIDPDDRSASVHFLVAPARWNEGIATEACRRVINHAFHSGFRILTSYHHAENPASGRVLEKCGMALNDEAFRDHDIPRLRGVYRCYAIQKQQSILTG